MLGAYERACPRDLGAVGALPGDLLDSRLLGAPSRRRIGPYQARRRSESVKKQKGMGHRNRSKTKRMRAKLRAKHRRVRLRKSSGERSTHR